MHDSYILQTYPVVFLKLLDYHGVPYYYNLDNEKRCFYVSGFKEYNFLHKINSVFSNNPRGDIIDRSGTIDMPFKMCVKRPWIKFEKLEYSLEEAIQKRVNELESSNQSINILWSGGIDSTSTVIGFLKHSKNLKNVRVLYSTLSIKENPGFFFKLFNRSDIQLIEFSGDFYLDMPLDGIFLTGDIADDLTGSLDKSFFEMVGYKTLNESWKDFFYKTTQDVEFVNFCEKFFSESGRPINTLLEARWWFYTNSKVTLYPSNASRLLNFGQPLVQGFFDNYYFENFVYFNLDKILPADRYNSYKFFLKEYIFEFDHDDDYFKNKIKTDSLQANLYGNKKTVLKNQRYIMLLGSGERIYTDNLPLLSEKEYRNKYQNRLDYLFNVL